MGHSVFAIDNAEGMLRELERKIRSCHLENSIRFECCSFTEIQTLPENKFDHVFSNFGGLNCIADLRLVTDKLPRFLKPGSMVTFVIMPHICPWEMLHFLTGNSTLAFRRLSKGGTAAHIEGHHFLTCTIIHRERLWEALINASGSLNYAGSQLYRRRRIWKNSRNADPGCTGCWPPWTNGFLLFPLLTDGRTM